MGMQNNCVHENNYIPRVAAFKVFDGPKHTRVHDRMSPGLRDGRH